MRFLVPAFLALAAAGCTASGYMRDADPTPPPGPDQAKVVVYRDSVIGGIDNFPVYAVRDGLAQLQGFTETDAYFEIRLAPGRVLFVTWCEGAAFIEADLEAGGTYYLRAWSKFGLLASRPGFAAVPADPESLRDLRCRELDPAQALPAAWDRKEHLVEVLAGFERLAPYACSSVPEYGVASGP